MPSSARKEILLPSASYPTIAVVVNVTPDAPATVVNQAGVSGGGSAAVVPHDQTTVAFSFTHPATTEIYTLSLHDALPISTYTIVISNTGTGPSAGAVTVTDNMP